MSAPDDRPWRAEDLLHCVVDAKAGDSDSTRQRIEQFFDWIEASTGEPQTISTAPGADRDASDDSSRAGAAPAQTHMPTVPPVEAPNHRLIRCLGAGGFGQVWLARHTLMGHDRACKLIPADKALELDGLRRLKQKVPGHPRLFPIDEVGASNGWLYCLMPLADNAATDGAVLDASGYEPLTLGVYLQRHGRRPTAEAASIGMEIAEAVGVLHEHGVTHGDIKPGNIMRLHGLWTLADYGLARDVSDPSGGGHTPGYTPPEGPGSIKADLFALGVVLMEMLTGRTARALDEFRKTPIERFTLDSDGPRLAEIILRATALEPNDRYGSASELRDALRPLARDAGGHSQSQGPRRQIWSGLALAATVALALGLWPFLSRQQSDPQAPSTTVTAPISIESFEVRQYRYDPPTDMTVAIGPINADNPAAREGDDVTLHARLSREGYVYLISLDADGLVRLRIPASPTDTPARLAQIDYPSLPTGAPGELLYTLSHGPGAQGFMLMVSDEPLPPWSDWIASRGEPSWTRMSLPPSGVILSDGRQTAYASAARDPMPRRGRLVLDPIDWAKAQRDLAASLIAFPVLPSEKN